MSSLPLKVAGLFPLNFPIMIYDAVWFVLTCLSVHDDHSWLYWRIKKVNFLCERERGRRIK